METLEWKNLYSKIVYEAWKDISFKESLIEEPIKAIESLTGEKINIKEGCRIVVEDQSDENKIYIIIPRKLQFEDVELSENQLESVSGGIDFIQTITDYLFGRS